MDMLDTTAAAFIGASVTLILVIIFMILMVVLVRQCLAFMAKRSTINAQIEAQRRAREQFERQRRGSITEPVPATFDWHHSIRIAGTPPPTYREAKDLPTLNDAIIKEKKKKSQWTHSNGIVEVDGDKNNSDSSESEAVQNDVADTSRSNEGEGAHTNVEMEVEVSSTVEGGQVAVAGSHDMPAISHDPEDVQIDMNDDES